MQLTKYFTAASVILMCGACIDPKVDLPQPLPASETATPPSLVPPADTRRARPLTPAERHRVEDGLAGQAVTPPPPPANRPKPERKPERTF